MSAQWQKVVTWQVTATALGIEHGPEKAEYRFHSLFHDLLRWKDQRVTSNVQTIKSFYKTWKNTWLLETHEQQ